MVMEAPANPASVTVALPLSSSLGGYPADNVNRTVLLTCASRTIIAAS